jgi:superfamily II DNA helicase RecQ
MVMNPSLRASADPPSAPLPRALASFDYLDEDEAGTAQQQLLATARDIAHNRFGHRVFRGAQQKVIASALRRRDVFVLMPTGGGKSLCYQLPALVEGGLTVVVSPLVSLMQDQVRNLKENNVAAAYFAADTSAEEQESIYARMEGRDGRGAPAEDPAAVISPDQLREEMETGPIRLIYVTPEKLTKSGRFLNMLERLYKRGCLTRIVIDESHCLSQWGHDFRKDYLVVGSLRERFPNSPMMALTATATPSVIVDVIMNLKMTAIHPADCKRNGLDLYFSPQNTDPQARKASTTYSRVIGRASPGNVHQPFTRLFRQSFNRENLIYEVRKKEGSTADAIAEIVRKRRHQTGIIYVLSQAMTENLSAHINKKLGSEASLPYHAGMDSQIRKENQEAWKDGRIRLIVATIAFGMGIDHSEVRYVIHESLPKSLPGLYQECGRAGRDGKSADCILFWSFNDRKSHEFLIEKSLEEGNTTPEMARVHRQELESVIQYCDNLVDCRREMVLRHFNEHFDKAACKKTCDNCRRSGSEIKADVTEEAAAFCSVVRAAQGNKYPGPPTVNQLILIFMGGKSKELERFKYLESERLWGLSKTAGDASESGDSTQQGVFPSILAAVGRRPGKEDAKLMVEKLIREGYLTETRYQSKGNEFSTFRVNITPKGTQLAAFVTRPETVPPRDRVLLSLLRLPSQEAKAPATRGRNDATPGESDTPGNNTVSSAGRKRSPRKNPAAAATASVTPDSDAGIPAERAVVSRGRGIRAMELPSARPSNTVLTGNAVASDTIATPAESKPGEPGWADKYKRGSRQGVQSTGSGSPDEIHLPVSEVRDSEDTNTITTAASVAVHLGPIVAPAMGQPGGKDAREILMSTAAKKQMAAIAPASRKPASADLPKDALYSRPNTPSLDTHDPSLSQFFPHVVALDVSSDEEEGTTTNGAVSSRIHDKELQRSLKEHLDFSIQNFVSKVNDGRVREGKQLLQAVGVITTQNQTDLIRMMPVTMSELRAVLGDQKAADYAILLLPAIHQVLRGFHILVEQMPPWTFDTLKAKMTTGPFAELSPSTLQANSQQHKEALQVAIAAAVQRGVQSKRKQPAPNGLNPYIAGASGASASSEGFFREWTTGAGQKRSRDSAPDSQISASSGSPGKRTRVGRGASAMPSSPTGRPRESGNASSSQGTRSATAAAPGSATKHSNTGGRPASQGTMPVVDIDLGFDPYADLDGDLGLDAGDIY